MLACVCQYKSKNISKSVNKPSGESNGKANEKHAGKKKNAATLEFTAFWWHYQVLI